VDNRLVFSDAEILRARRFVNAERANDFLGWLGTLLVIIGSALLAFDSHFSKWGWWAYLASAIVLVVRSHKRQDWSMLVQQAVFVVVNIFGLYRWFR
jgi:hypothetical protein